MDGRSLGTERSSTFPDGLPQSQSGTRVSDALAGGERFAAMLSRRTEHGGGADAQVDLSERVREGRTDAAAATYNSREAQTKAWKPRNERTVERRDSSDAWEAQGGDVQPDPGARSDASQVAEDPVGPPPEQASDWSAPAQEEASPTSPPAEMDPSDAHGLAGNFSVLPAAAGPMGSSATQGPANAVSISSAQGSSGVLPIQALSGAAATKGQSASPAQAVQSVAATSAAKRAAKASAPSANVPPGDARAILNEVRMHILEGKREARIQLRPIELGRLDLLIRVDAGHVTAKVAAESAEALAVLEAHAPELRAWLAKDGTESVDLEFSLIEPDSEAFAHEDSESGAPSFESAAERRSLVTSGRPRRAAPGSDEPEDAGVHLLRNPPSGRTSSAGVDFVA